MLHDASEKIVLGQSGRFAGDDVLDKLISPSATSQRLVWRLSQEFFGDRVVSDEARDELTIVLRDHDLDIRWVVETMLRSELFFSDANVGRRSCNRPNQQSRSTAESRKLDLQAYA